MKRLNCSNIGIDPFHLHVAIYTIVNFSSDTRPPLLLQRIAVFNLISRRISNKFRKIQNESFRDYELYVMFVANASIFGGMVNDHEPWLR